MAVEDAAAVLVGIAGGLIGVFVNLLFARTEGVRIGPITVRRGRAEEGTPQQQRQQRIEEALKALNHSSELLDELRRDVADGLAQTMELEQRIERNTALADLSEEQAKAVQETMTAVVGAGNRRSFWQQAALNLFFFALGVGVTVLAN